jgi:hypothetical protein
VTRWIVFSIALMASCTPIEPRPVSVAPVNACPCEQFTGETRVPRCVSGRCEIITPGGRPEYPFYVVVHVPQTSTTTNAGQTHVFFADTSGEPAFKATTTGTATSRCAPPGCLALAGVTNTTGEYLLGPSVSEALGFPLRRPASIPVRAVHQPLGNDQQSAFPALPLEPFITDSVRQDGTATLARALPFGRYRRTFSPLAPYDEIFPPVSDEIEIPGRGPDQTILTVTPPASGSVDHQVDDLDGDSRQAVIKRTEGLDGWRAWLADRLTNERISVIRTLSGTESTVTLYTARGAFGADVDAVVAPPAGWLGVPQLVSIVPGGAGLKNLVYPTIPPPASVVGVVGVPADGDGVLGFAARVTFTLPESPTLLRYSAVVDTDEFGRFATILPHGNYVATIEPAEGTGFGKTEQNAVVDRARTALLLSPPRRTQVRGRAVLTDGRPLSEATVIVTPQQRSTGNAVIPRPGRTTTDADGRFSIELDQGAHVFSIVPVEGTGFPRVVVLHDVPASPTELPDIRVPAPSRLSFTLRGSGEVVPVRQALVRVFAVPANSSGTIAPIAPVEVGSAMSDGEGKVEILLAQEPR